MAEKAHQRTIGEYFTKLWTHQGEGINTTRELRAALVVLETLGDFLALDILAVMDHKASDLPNLPDMAQITSQYKSSKKMFKTLEFNFPKWEGTVAGWIDFSIEVRSFLYGHGLGCLLLDEPIKKIDFSASLGFWTIRWRYFLYFWSY